MSLLDELLKDLVTISHEIEDKSTTVGAIFDLEAFNVNYRRDYAARLIELGYVKVVRCGECREATKAKTVRGEYYTCSLFPWIIGARHDQFCSMGLPRLVAKSATTETVAPAPEKAE